jgi:hypothetical protein
MTKTNSKLFSSSSSFFYLAKQHFSFVVILLLSAFVKFSSPGPVVWMQDSVKYHVPLNVIIQQNWSWITDTLNPSLITRIIYFVIQSLDYGSPEKIILFQKLLNILSTILFYLICLKLSKNKKNISLIAVTIFSFNPLALFMEQALMAETIFVFFSFLSCLLFILVLESSFTKYTFLFALVVGIFSMVKDSSGLYLNLIYAFLLISALIWKNVFRLKKIFLFIIITQLLVLPLKFYNWKKFGVFANNRYQGTGAVLWFLTEEMLRSKPPQDNIWLTQYLLTTTEKFKSSFKIQNAKSSRQAFFAAVISINSPGRVGALAHPETQKLLSSKEWNSIAVKYWLETIILNPQLSIKSLWVNVNEYLFTNNLYFKSDVLYSLKPELNREFSFFTLVPFSLKDQFDPNLKNCQIIKPLFISEAGEIFTDASFKTIVKNSYALMINTNTNYAFVIPEKGLSVLIQKSLYRIPLSKIVLPLFLTSLLFFLLKNNSHLAPKELLIAWFLILSSIFFLVLPVLIHGEPRYQIQFTHLMIFFIVFVYSRIYSSNR